ncbi:MAG: hypothetical protein K6G12_06180 [Lachnospiraceae bacterium]|nr:hypothetical protein [Lachnospiraceae bacterium]
MSIRIGSGFGYGMWGAFPGYSTGSAGVSGADKTSGAVLNPGEDTKVSPGRKSSPAECETCKNRKYQDGSNEMVSFKSAQHMDPREAATRVRAHEQEHVVNAYDKAAQNNGKVLQASVAIHTAICPECGTSYVSGGLTTTKIKYSDEGNPYQQDMKAQHGDALRGANVDFAV